LAESTNMERVDFTNEDNKRNQTSEKQNM